MRYNGLYQCPICGRKAMFVDKTIPICGKCIAENTFDDLRRVLDAVRTGEIEVKCFDELCNNRQKYLSLKGI